MKKVIYLYIITFCILFITACSNQPTSHDKEHTYTVCCTVFAAYDWARECIGDQSDIELVYLLDDGEDMHSYQPSVSDIAKITEADMFIYVGGPSDDWVLSLLDSSGNPDQIRVCMMDELADVIKEEEIVEGMQTREEDHHDSDMENAHIDGDDAEEEIEYDEHVWLSFDNAKVIVASIAGALGDMDSLHREQYLERGNQYAERLDSIKASYVDRMESRTRDTIIVADRFPFRYMVDEFEINYYAAFPGCSAESESSFETIVFLIEKAKDNHIETVYVLENADAKLANTISENSIDDMKILVLDSMQSVTEEDIESGASYEDYMIANMDALLEGLE